MAADDDQGGSRRCYEAKTLDVWNLLQNWGASLVR